MKLTGCLDTLDSTLNFLYSCARKRRTAKAFPPLVNLEQESVLTSLLVAWPLRFDFNRRHIGRTNALLKRRSVCTNRGSDA